MSCLYPYSLIFIFSNITPVMPLELIQPVIIIQKPPSGSACTSHCTWSYVYVPKRHMSQPKALSYLACVLHRHAGMPQWCILRHPTYCTCAQADIPGWNRKNRELFLVSAFLWLWCMKAWRCGSGSFSVLMTVCPVHGVLLHKQNYFLPTKILYKHSNS